MGAGAGPVYGEEGKKMKPIAVPKGFVKPTPKKQGSANSGVSCIPNVASYPKPSRPIIIYESEASADCRRVREAVSMLDLPGN